MISESRPKTVMNHGAPAATTTRSGKSGSKMRSAPRSSALRRDHRLEPLVIGLDLGHLAAPLGQALGRGGPVDGLPAQIAGVDGLALDHRVELEARRPLASGGHDRPRS